MPDRTYGYEPTTRRSFLSAATAGAGVVALGAAGWGLLGSMAPSADVVAASKPIEVDLSGIAEGTEKILTVYRSPVIVRHRRPDEIASAEASDPADLIDPFSRDMFGGKLDSTNDQVRRATHDGRFIALFARCTRLDCVVLSGAGDFKAWFCPCCGTHYDSSGRARKGLAPWNLLLAVTRQTEDGRLLIASTRQSAQGKVFART